MEHSESINELGAALSKAQGIIEGAKKDSNNPFFKSKYADLSSVWESCRLALSSNGLSIIQNSQAWIVASVPGIIICMHLEWATG